nr:MAG TPA: hypothetical protein [Caudoviricetes sp.]
MIREPQHRQNENAPAVWTTAGAKKYNFIKHE